MPRKLLFGAPSKLRLVDHGSRRRRERVAMDDDQDVADGHFAFNPARQ